MVSRVIFVVSTRRVGSSLQLEVRGGCGQVWRGGGGGLTAHKSESSESHELSPRVEAQLRVARIIECVCRVREWPVQQVEVERLDAQATERAIEGLPRLRRTADTDAAAQCAVGRGIEAT